MAAAALANVHHTVSLQPRQRLADHRARDAEHLAQPGLRGQALSGREIAREDPVEDPAVDLIRESRWPDRRPAHVVALINHACPSPLAFLKLIQ